MRPPTSIKNRFGHSCFPVNFKRFLRINFWQIISCGCFWLDAAKYWTRFKQRAAVLPHFENKTVKPKPGLDTHFIIYNDYLYSNTTTLTFKAINKVDIGRTKESILLKKLANLHNTSTVDMYFKFHSKQYFLYWDLIITWVITWVLVQFRYARLSKYVKNKETIDAL